MGCNTNLLSKKAFNLLPTRIKKLLEENERFGLLADGSRLPFHGVIRLAGHLRNVPIEESFVVSEINDDAILGMPFLMTHECRLDFSRPILSLGWRDLMCTDRFECLMVSNVQV